MTLKKHVLFLRKDISQGAIGINTRAIELKFV